MSKQIPPPSVYTRAVADRVAAARSQARLAREDVASALGMTRAPYGRRETGATPFDVHELVILADLFRVNLDWLLLGEQPLADVAAELRRSRPRVEDIESEGL